MASPERDEPRSLRKAGFAGTGGALPLQKMASPERDEPRSLQNVASTERTMHVPYKMWLRRNARCTFPTK